MVMKNVVRYAFACAAVAMGALLPLAAADEVWVSDLRGSDTTGDGTFDAPYKTIQKGVDEVDAGGTVKVKAGTYDEGETWAGSHSNRVSITKKVFLEGVDGKDVTHIVGFRDHVNGDAYGRGTTSVRCIYITTGANGGMMRGFTIRDGGTTAASDKSAWGGGVGGGVNTSNSSKSTSTFCLVDCVVSNCAAVIGGGLDGATAVRCLIAGNMSSSYGAGARFCNLMNCLVASNVVIGSKAYAAVGGGTNVNCTVVNTTGTKAYGFGIASTATAGKPKIYNCVSFGNGYADIVGSDSVSVKTNSYTTLDDANMLYDPDNGDYRLMAGSVAVGGGLTEHLSIVALPAGVSPYIPYGGNEIDSGSETCDAGCFQGAVSPEVKAVTVEAANGGLAVTGGVVGENVLEPGSSITISESDTGTRPCVGFSVNGTGYLFADTPSVTFTAEQVEASDRGYAVSAIYTKDWYVDANAADDSASGFRAAKPKRTLAAVMPLTSSGDTVHAASGSYTNGTMVSNSTEGRTVKARVAVKAGVTLVADDGPDVTFIVGESDTDAGNANNYGMSTNAVRCVHLGKNAVVRGFTLTGGRTWWDLTLYTASTSFGQVDSSYLGGGVCGTSTGYSETYVEDCVISNNCAYFGGGAAFTRLVRCRVFDNKATSGGGAMYKAGAYGSVINRSRAGTSGAIRSAIYQFYDIVGCTLGADNRYIDSDSYVRALYSGMGASDFHHNLVLGTVDGSLSKTVSYCVFANGCDNYPTNETCIVAKSPDVAVDENLRPIAGRNPAVDAGSLDVLSTYAQKLSPYETDISGEPRVRNGRIDIGALESDPKPWYAKLLDGKGRHITVTAADASITNIAHGVTLKGGESLALSWGDASFAPTRCGKVKVSGPGTLSVTLNGAPFATYSAADGEREFRVSPAGLAALDFVFSFVGEGSADIYGFSASAGLVFIVQ